MKKRFVSLAGVVVFVSMLASNGVSALSSSGVVIVELQTGSINGAAEEYIILANTGTVDTDLQDWQLEYFSSNATSLTTPTRKIPLTGSIGAHSTLVVAATGYKTDTAKIFYSATLASAGGHLRLTRPDADTRITEDLIGWGTAKLPEGSVAPAPAADGQLIRRVDATGEYIDTDNNAADFSLISPPETPKAPSPVNQPSSQTIAATNITSVESPKVSATISQIDITELLPNPAAPATDSDDEYVELFNPNSFTVNLRYYQLQTGTTFSHKYVFEDENMAAGEYRVFLVSQTKASLSNTEGKARLLLSDGTTISETASYSDAKEGQSWALFDDGWSWTVSPTPGAANILETAPVKTSSSSSKKSTTSSKAATTQKTLGAKTTSSADDPAKTDNVAADTQSVTPVHIGIIAGVGLIAVLYAAYEYRHDVANKLHQFRANRANRRAAGKRLEGRGSPGIN